MKFLFVLLALGLVGCNAENPSQSNLFAGDYIAKTATCKELPSQLVIRDAMSVNLSATYGSCAEKAQVMFHSSGGEIASFTVVSVPDCETAVISATEAGFVGMEFTDFFELTVTTDECVVKYERD